MRKEFWAGAAVPDVDVVKLNWLDAVGKPDGMEAEEGTPNAGMGEGHDDDVVADTQFDVKLTADEATFWIGVVATLGAAAIGLSLSSEKDKTDEFDWVWVAVAPKLTAEGIPVTGIGRKLDDDRKRNEPIEEAVVGAAKLTAGFVGLNTNPPGADAPTDGNLVADVDAALTAGNIGRNSLGDAATEVDELAETDVDGGLKATADVVSKVDIVMAGLLMEG